jgi:predicted metalloendopeptidase
MTHLANLTNFTAALIVAGGLFLLAAPGWSSSAVDSSVRPQDDLYLHANGAWLKTTEIPADRPSCGSFTILQDVTRDRVQEILDETVSRDFPPNSPGKKVGDFYQSFLNEALVEQLGLAPLENQLDQVERLNTRAEVVRHFGLLGQLGVRSPIALYVAQDPGNSSNYLAAVCQSGTTLPDRQYYLADDKKFAQARGALHTYVTRLLTSSGHDNPGQAARSIVELEHRLAQIEWERIALRDAQKTYNLREVDQLPELAPGIRWEVFLRGAGLPELPQINLVTPSFFTNLSKIIGDTEVATWRDYLKFRILDTYAVGLPKAYVDAHFEFYGKTLAGIPQPRSRQKRAVVATAGDGAGDFGVLGDAVGEMYVQRFFPPAAKAKMEGLLDNLMTAFRQSIDELPWMSVATKARAAEKLARMTTKIGYPSKWRDYSSLEIREDELIANLLRSAKHDYGRMIDQLNKPVDRQEWGMTPQTVNAYYNPRKNEIVFPAAILQPPFFGVDQDDASNYGAIGAVIGHEISHGFDDQGSRYDGDGNLTDWWTAADRKAFQERTSQLVEQFDAYEALPGRHVNGRLTLGENIADLAGLAIAHKAYQISKDQKGLHTLDDYGDDQRFFLAWSRAWRCRYREAELLKRLVTDSHAPARFRANGPVSNIEAFYRAFQLTPQDRLFRPENQRLRIW